MLATEAGILNDSILHDENELVANATTSFGITVFLQPLNKVLVLVTIMALQLSRES